MSGLSLQKKTQPVVTITPSMRRPSLVPRNQQFGWRILRKGRAVPPHLQGSSTSTPSRLQPGTAGRSLPGQRFAWSWGGGQGGAFPNCFRVAPAVHCLLSQSPQQMQESLPVDSPKPRHSRTEPWAASLGGSHAQCPRGADTRPRLLLPSSNKAGQRKLTGLDLITQLCFPKWEGATGPREGVWTLWPQEP